MDRAVRAVAGEDDVASAVVVDGQGRVYLAGLAGEALPGLAGAGGTDAFLRRYDPSGQVRWTAQFGSARDDNAAAIAVDAQGDIYVAGLVKDALPGQTSFGGTDAFLRKYTAEGEEVWTRQFGSAGDDAARAVAVGPDGGVYVAGPEGGTMPIPGWILPENGSVFLLRYSAQGDLAWTEQVYGTPGLDVATGLAVGPSGDVYLAGGTGLGAHDSGSFLTQYTGWVFLSRYSPSGTSQSDSGWGMSGKNPLLAIHLAMDSQGNRYVAENRLDIITEASQQPTLKKINPQGAEQWVRTLGKPSGAAVQVAYNDVAVDSRGNIFVGGMGRGTLPDQKAGGGDNAFVGTFDGSGEALWSRHFGASCEGEGLRRSCPTQDDVLRVAVSGQGDVYILGRTSGFLDGRHFTTFSGPFLRRYTSGGEEVWTRSFGCINDDPELSCSRVGAFGLALDRAGNIYVAGNVVDAIPPPAGTSTVQTFGDAALWKFSPEGQLLWSRQFGTDEWDTAWSVAAGPDGTVYIAGETRGGVFPGQSPSGRMDAFLRKYTPDGEEDWTVQFGGPRDDRALSLAITPEGFIVVAGSMDSAPFIASYGTDGRERWSRRLEGAYPNGQLSRVVVDVEGRIYGAGVFTGHPIFLSRFSTAGEEVWTQRIATVASKYNLSGRISVAVGPGGNVVVAGNRGRLEIAPGAEPFLRMYTPEGEERWAR